MDALGITFVALLGLLMLGRLLGYLSTRPIAARSVTISAGGVIGLLVLLVIGAVVLVGVTFIFALLNCITGGC